MLVASLVLETMDFIHFAVGIIFLGTKLDIAVTCECSISPYCARDCSDIQDLGFETSGVYRIYPGNIRYGINVYCDMETDEGGWLVFQRREDGSIDFNQTWSRYQTGFGDLLGEHWLGNYNLTIVLSQSFYELRVDMEDWEGNTTFAKYRYFGVGKRSDNYRLDIGGYYGDATTSMNKHYGAPFSTYDKDNSKLNCTNFYQGGWWFSEVDCIRSNLNGPYVENGSADFGNGIIWKSWKGKRYSLKRTEMKIRRL